MEDVDEDKLLTTHETADLLRVTVTTIHQWKKEGILPYYRLNRRIYFKKSEVLDSLKKAQTRVV